MKRLLFLFITASLSVLHSCTTDKYPHAVGVEVLENQSFALLRVSCAQRDSLNVDDTLWMNMDTHLIDTVEKDVMRVRVLVYEDKKIHNHK